MLFQYVRSIDFKDEIQPMEEVVSDLHKIFPIRAPYCQQIKILKLHSDYQNWRQKRQFNHVRTLESRFFGVCSVVCFKGSFWHMYITF